MDYNILIRLILAHLISDFILQSTKWAESKDNKGFSSGYLYWHVIVTGITSLILVWNLNWFIPIAAITLIHGLCDGLKGEINKRCLNLSSPKYLFFIDQLIHLITIIIIWLIVTKQWVLFGKEITHLCQNENTWYYLLGYVFISLPLAVIIGKLTESWSKELDNTAGIIGFQNKTTTKNNQGLNNAGRWIGVIERIMIFTFILIHQFAAIGFLLAAKSVLRFGDLKDNTNHKKTEYIIIGTFLSFMLAIFTGLAINYLTK